MRVFVQKMRVLEDDASECCRAATYHEEASVDRIGGAELKVVSFQVDSAQEVPESSPAEAQGVAANDLVRRDRSDRLVFERCDDRGQEILGTPEDVVVSQNRDRRGDLR